MLVERSFYTSFERIVAAGAIYGNHDGKAKDYNLQDKEALRVSIQTVALLYCASARHSAPEESEPYSLRSPASPNLTA